MVREVAITIYLFIFSLIFAFFKRFSLQNKVVFVVSFSENNQSIYKEMIRQDSTCRIIFLATEQMYPTFSKLDGASTLFFEWKNPVQFLKGIYHLATSKVVMVDNYYGFLAQIRFRDSVQCIQLWHANGAIKKFGLKDPSNETRSNRAIQRFKRVYNSFDKVVVGSEAMADIFKQAFGVEDQRVVRTGIPRTDIFFNHSKQTKIVQNMYKQYPSLKNKKVILYAPTYREKDLQDFQLQLNLEELLSQLKQEYVLIIKLHPAIKSEIDIPSEFDHLVYDFSDYHSMNELLFVSDLLITDYSSIPFEYSLLNRPIIFYLYDLEEYLKERGMWEDYLEFLPGPIAYTTKDIGDIIRAENVDYERILRFSEKWNEYSKGLASKNIVDMLSDHLRNQ
ncbi:CDP-glycerol glycerophosphotransferase family protein [Bacillus sp. CH30_1T]|uniref:CDP-glycerol glycerophosphotransferase family protein n=1 Tax=Bacillus sp. CH30_1T TaxID=2604836 RepID=UPI0011EE37CC|nr:CDP-glycerol glycerophosphotransferase family protein [Bacillus sp. CH30_1T]KAA0565881.1 CDP-glycerol glycerophosphotransferase family protein [Bacillus sp. CH30_1T]